VQDPFVRRIIVPLAASVVALLIIIAFSLWVTASTTADANLVIRERHVRELGVGLLDLLQDMETGNRGYLLTRDRSFLAPYEAAEPKVGTVLKEFKESLANDSAATPLLARLTADIAAKLQLMATTNASAAAGRVDAAAELAQLARGKAAMDDIRDTLGQLIGRSGAHISERLDSMQSNTRLLVWVSISASLLIVLVGSAALWIAIRYTRELLQARQAVEEANASLEERVQERTLDLVRANEEIQRYAYIVTHDLRAPLVNIVGFTSELEAGLKLAQEYVAATANENADPATEADGVQSAVNQDMPEAIGFIRASTTKMDKLISAILKLSREGRRQLHPDRVDLKALIDATVASVQHQLEEHNVQIEVADRLPVIVSDRLALEQIFGNLLDNAVKYLAPGRPGEIRIAAADHGRTVLITVEDNGRGIAPEDHERIFELFRRSGSQTVSGEGIGLAHVRALVRRLGGEITVESEVGRGSRFKVLLSKYLALNVEKKEA
jgi:signal transduction histidine kinase